MSSEEEYNEEEEGKDRVMIIDNGSCNSKIGFSTFKKPRIIPTCIGFPMNKNPSTKNAEIGDDVLKIKSRFNIDYPIQEGKIKDITKMKIFWEKELKEILYKYEKEEDRDIYFKVILTEPPLTTKKDRELIAEEIFGMYKVYGLFISNPAILSLISTGRETGVLVDSGYEITQIVPIYCNFRLQHAVKHLYLGGKDLTDYMRSLLFKAGYTSANIEYSASIKKRVCYLAENYGNKNAIPYELHLPDDKEIILKEERVMCPEVLFNPQILGKKKENIVDACYNSIEMCDNDIKHEMFDNIILSGGNTRFKGLKQRYLSEMKDYLPLLKVDNIIEAENNRYSAWEGAKIIAKLSGMETNWISRTEYEEIGAKIVNRKFF